MSDLLIRNIKPQLKRQLDERARKHGRSLSAEAESCSAGLAAQAPAEHGRVAYSLVDEKTEVTIWYSNR